MVVRGMVLAGVVFARVKRTGGSKMARTVRFMPPPVSGVMVMVSAGRERAVDR